MPRRTLVATAIGALLGAVLALGVMAVIAGLVLEQAVGVAVVDEAAGRVRSEFVVQQGAMHILVVVIGAIGGAALGLIGYGIGRSGAPDGERLNVGPVAVIGLAIGLVLGFAVARAAIGVAADIEGGIVTMSVFRTMIVALVTGASVGGVVGGTVERISRAEALGLEGEAWPTSPVAFMRDAMTAMGLPMLAIVGGGAIVFLLSRVLLETPKEVALTIFSGAAALVLFGAAFIAANPQRGDTSD